jgi:predicted permease
MTPRNAPAGVPGLTHGTAEAPRARTRFGLRGGLDGLMRDARIAVRMLRRNPGYSAVAVLTLALGIGANTAVFSVVNGVLLRPLPYPEPDRLVALFQTDSRGARRLPWSVPNLREIEGATRAFAAIVGYRSRDLTLTGLGDPQLVNATAVSGSILGVFGVRPALGRDIRRDETLPGGRAVVVVSHAFWRQRLGGDPSAVGRTLQLSGASYEIVGVAPAGFAYPQAAEICVPGQWSERDFGRGRLTVRVIGRLAPGATFGGGLAELSIVARRLTEAYPESNAGMGVNLASLEDYLVGNVRVGLLVLLSAVGMVLLIACVNVANLVLVRGANRAGELAVRSTLGASRGALVRQLLTESLVLSLASGALGVLLARWGVRGLRLLAVGRIPRMDDATVDGTVLLFAAALAVAVTVLFGLAPALHLSRVSISSVIRQGREPAAGLLGGRRARASLLGAETALSLALLVGAGLLLRSFIQVRSVELGFDAEGVRQFSLTLPGTRYDDRRAIAFFDALRERLAGIPGVVAVGMASGSPLGSSHVSRQIGIVGEPEPLPGEEPLWLVTWSSPGYTRTLGIPLLRGRDLSPADRENAPKVALISKITADRFFPGKDPVGQRFYFAQAGPMWTIVGVVGDVRSLDVIRAAEPEVYLPYAQWSRPSMTVMVRTGRDVPGLVGAIRRGVSALDPNLAIYNIQTLDEAVASSTSSERFYLLLLGLFAGLAMILATVGVYGVVAYVVSGRRREIGIRIALGAKQSDVVRMITAEGMRPVFMGVLVGLGGALAGARALTSLLYEVDPWDPWTFAGGTALLVAAAALACVLPARSASHTSPTEAMRAE